jgi:hypothetical protein
MLRAMASVYRVGASQATRLWDSRALRQTGQRVEFAVTAWQIEEERKREIAELLLIKAAAVKRAKRQGGKARQPSRSLSPRIAAASRFYLTASSSRLKFRANP